MTASKAKETNKPPHTSFARPTPLFDVLVLFAAPVPEGAAVPFTITEPLVCFGSGTLAYAEQVAFADTGQSDWLC